MFLTMLMTLIDRLLAMISAKSRFIAGLALLAVGAVCGVLHWGAGWKPWAACLTGVVGLLLLLSAREELAGPRAIAAEAERARGEWQDLEREGSRVLREGGNLARLLQARGYRQHAVRHWIAEQLREAFARGTAATEFDGCPLTATQLCALFTELDAASATGYECDHDFALTRRFLEQLGLPVLTTLRWLGEQGAGCDCEVIANVAERWGNRVGFAPEE